VKITIKNLQKKISLHPKTVKKAVLNTLSQEGIKKSGEIAIYFVNDKKIKGLNLKYLGRNNPTDVIAFDISEPKISHKIFADIFISTDQALVNSRPYKTSLGLELYRYVIHGVLHILGYTHKSRRDKLIMEKKEKALIETLNLSPITHNS